MNIFNIINTKLQLKVYSQVSKSINFLEKLLIKQDPHLIFPGVPTIMLFLKGKEVPIHLCTGNLKSDYRHLTTVTMRAEQRIRLVNNCTININTFIV